MAKRHTVPPPPDKVKLRNDSHSDVEQGLEKELEGARARNKVYEISAGAAIQAAAFRGMLLYIEHPGMSSQQIYERFRLSDDPTSPWLRELCSGTTFQKWAVRGEWERKRLEHWRGIETRVLKMMQTRQVQQEIEEIAVLQAAGEQLTMHIHGGTDTTGKVVPPTKPRSLEGAINALIAIDRRRAEKRSYVMASTAASVSEEDLDPQAARLGGPQGAPVEDEMSDAEIEEFAHRFAMRRAGMKIDGGDDDGGEGEGEDTGEE